MSNHDGGPDEPRKREDYRRLPDGVPVADTVGTVDADPVPDPESGRNTDQHRALRDD
jgi:hypothetical protein